jgi:hypothetical protein
MEIETVVLIATLGFFAAIAALLFGLLRIETRKMMHQTYRH